jgi:hypothetical protein
LRQIFATVDANPRFRFRRFRHWIKTKKREHPAFGRVQNQF